MNIHMFCGRRPGLLLSTVRALDNLGLDIQQAVISCFNGFAMDIFRAEVKSWLTLTLDAFIYFLSMLTPKCNISKLIILSPRISLLKEKKKKKSKNKFYFKIK